MAPRGQKLEAAAFPGCSILHPSVRGIWACWGGNRGGSGGPWRRVEGSCPVAVFLRTRLGEPGAEISGGLAAPRLSTGITHILRALAQDGSKSPGTTVSSCFSAEGGCWRGGVVKAGTAEHIWSWHPHIPRAAELYESRDACWGDQTMHPRAGATSQQTCQDPRVRRGSLSTTSVLTWLHRRCAVPGVLPRQPC